MHDLSRNNGTQKDLELLKNHVALALETVPFWVNRSYAEEVLKFSATKKPYDVLTKHQDYSRKPFFSSVLETVAHNDPNAVKQYMGAQHTVNTTLKASSDPVVKKLYEVFFNYGRTSSGYTNIHMVFNGEMTRPAGLPACANFAAIRIFWVLIRSMISWLTTVWVSFAKLTCCTM